MPIDKMPMDKMLIDRNALLIIDQKSSQVGSQKCLRVVAPANISAREASIYLPDLIAAIKKNLSYWLELVQGTF